MGILPRFDLELNGGCFHDENAMVRYSRGQDAIENPPHMMSHFSIGVTVALGCGLLSINPA